MPHTTPRGEEVCGHPCSEYIVNVFRKRPGIGFSRTAAEVNSHGDLHDVVCLYGNIAKALREVEASQIYTCSTSTDRILFRSGQFNQLTRSHVTCSLV